MSDLVEIHLLGRFSVRRGGREVPPGAFGGSLVRALVRILLTRRGEFLPSDVLGEGLWPGRLPADPAANLRVLVARARRALGEGPFILTGRGGYSFASDERCTVDAETFITRADAGRHELRSGHPDAALQELRAALRLWGGLPLPEDAYAEWAQEYRRALGRAHKQALEDAADAALEVGDAAAAVTFAELAASAEPLREAAHLLLARALSTSGDAVQALRCLDGLRRRLREDLGVELSPDARELELRILRGERVAPAPRRHGSIPVQPSSRMALVGRDAEPATERLDQLVIEGDFPPVRAAGDRPTNLPRESTSFVGREREVAEITGLLCDARLLTLTGPGGTGKTRLALRAAANQLERFADGVFWVDLSEISDPSLVTSAIATSLRVRHAGAKSVLDSIVEHLAGRQLLLLLDNFEQVVEAAAAVAVVLEAAPGVRVLATSRLPLHLQGEQEYAVPPLTLPDPSRPLELRSLMEYEAVALFVQRAKAVRSGFALIPQDARAVVEICARLDGLPLAIELAASRVKVLTPQALLARLGQRLPLLTGGSIDRPERQRTLRSAIEWSYDLLEDPERRLFARLAAFAGGWTLESAETVCGAAVAGDAGPAASFDVLDLLGSLVDRSLVRRDEAPDGDLRFGTLETIQEFASERLAESGEEEEVRRRHAEHFRDLSEEGEPHLTGDGQARWLQRLELEHDNLRGALAWCLRTGQAETGVRIARAMWRFWQRGGHLAEGRATIERLLLMPEAQRRDALRANALATLGSIAYWQNDYPAMARAYEEALEISRAIGDLALLAHALLNASFVPLVMGDIVRAEELQRETLAAAAAAGARDVIAETALSIGNRELFQGNPGAAVAPIEEAIALRRQAGDRISLAEGLLGLAVARLVLGEVEASEALVREARRLHKEAANVMGIVATLFPEASLANQRGRYRRGAQLIGAWTRLGEELGGGPPPFVFSFFGDPDGQAREVLGDQEYQQARAEGYAMSLDEAVALAEEGVD